jgi:hypothetical protein
MVIIDASKAIGETAQNLICLASYDLLAVIQACEV